MGSQQMATEGMFPPQEAENTTNQSSLGVNYYSAFFLLYICTTLIKSGGGDDVGGESMMRFNSLSETVLILSLVLSV